MTNARKVDLLYRKAKGQNLNANPKEMAELSHYKVDFGEGDFYSTRANIRDYVAAVDRQGCGISFYDWCMNEGRADQRRRGSSKKAMAASQRGFGGGLMFVGAITWGMALYYILGKAVGVIPCMVVGAVVSFVIGRMSRRFSLFNVFLLPIIILALVTLVF